MTQQDDQPIIPLEYQVAIFPENFQINNVGQVAAKLMLMTDYFSPESVSMTPFDMSAPPEIERVSIWSPNKDLKVSISPLKLAFFWVNEPLDKKFNFNLSDGIDLVTKVFTNLEIQKIKINRVGFITTIIKRIDDPYALVKSKTIKTPLQNDLTSAEMTLVYSTDINSNNCNLHLRMNTVFLNKNRDDKVVQVQYDINTHQDEKLRWDLDKVNKFLLEAINKSDINVIFNTFFGEENNELKI